jgi:hypothetical protein
MKSSIIRQQNLSAFTMTQKKLQNLSTAQANKKNPLAKTIVKRVHLTTGALHRKKDGET